MHRFDGVDASHFWLPLLISIDVAEDDHLSVGAVGGENLSGLVNRRWTPCGRGILRQTLELSGLIASMECALDDCCMAVSEGVTRAQSLRICFSRLHSELWRSGR